MYNIVLYVLYMNPYRDMYDMYNITVYECYIVHSIIHSIVLYIVYNTTYYITLI